MIKKDLSIPFFTIIYLLFFIAIFSYSHLNWREDLFLFVFIVLYTIGRIFWKTVPGLWNKLIILLLIFLLSQFFINDFHPRSVGWWFASFPGWLTMLAALVGVTALVYQQRSIKSKSTANREIQDGDEALYDLINKSVPGIMVVSAAMFFALVLNIGEISPHGKLTPDYSIYIIIPFGFALFYSLDFFLKFISPGKLRIFVEPFALTVLVLLLASGSIKIYKVYTAYRNALGVESFTGRANPNLKEKWRNVLELNSIPGIQSIDTKAMTELGNISMAQGNFTRALSYYKKILADQAFDFEANLGIAEIAYKQKEWSLAYKMYKKLIYLRPQATDVYSHYVHACLKDNRIDKALEFIRNLKETHPIDLYEPEDYLVIGNAFLKKKRFNESIAYLQKGKESLPQNYKAYFLLGSAYLESGKHMEACNAFEKATQLKPNLAKGYYYLGIGYENIHQNHKAVEAFEKLVSIDNKNIKGFYHLKRLYTNMGMEDKAIEVGNSIENIATRVVEAAEWKGRSGKNIYRNGNMYWNGTVSTPVFLKQGNVKFILQARGTPAKETWPHMVVKLDDKIMGEVDVTSEKLRDYKFKKGVKPGKYRLKISFTNNGGVRDKNGKLIEDRNLFVRRCRIVYEK